MIQIIYLLLFLNLFYFGLGDSSYFLSSEIYQYILNRYKQERNKLTVYLNFNKYYNNIYFLN